MGLSIGHAHTTNSLIQKPHAGFADHSEGALCAGLSNRASRAIILPEQFDVQVFWTPWLWCSRELCALIHFSHQHVDLSSASRWVGGLLSAVGHLRSCNWAHPWTNFRWHSFPGAGHLVCRRLCRSKKDCALSSQLPDEPVRRQRRGAGTSSWRRRYCAGGRERRHQHLRHQADPRDSGYQRVSCTLTLQLSFCAQ